MTRLGALFLEQPRIFDGDTGFARQHAQQFQVTFVKRLVFIGKNGHGADRAGHTPPGARNKSNPAYG